MVELMSYELFAALTLASMVANGSAALVSRGLPLDRGARFIDGRRILGDGKTVEGLLTSVAFGASVGLTLLVALNRLDLEATALLVLVLVASVGGDIVASFFKRRAGLERGHKLVPVDQLDFYLSYVAALLAAGYAVDPLLMVVVGVVVYVLHRATNVAAYKLGLKDRPW